MDFTTPNLVDRAIENVLRSRFGDGDSGPWFTEYQGRELDFIRDVLGLRHPRTGVLRMWEFQRYFVEAVFKHRFVCVFGNRGSGKGYAAGALVPAFFYTAPSRVLYTAPGLRQVREMVGAEVMQNVKRAGDRLPGRKLVSKLVIDDKHVCLGIPAKDEQHVRGFHAAPRVPGDPDADELSPEDIEALVDELDDSVRLLLLIDEPQGIDPEIFRALAGMFNKPNTYCAYIGNPTLGLDDQHAYVEALDPASRFHTIKTSAFPETMFPDPNTYDKVFDRIPRYLVDEPSLERALREYEPTDPIFMSDWLGQFSSGSTASLVITRSILQAALALNSPARPKGPRIGVDIGTGNPDPCVASLFDNGVKRAVHEWRPDKDDDQAQLSIATTIMALASKWGKECAGPNWDGSPIIGQRLSIDDSGLVGVGDILSSRGVPCDRVNFGAGASGSWIDLTHNRRFKNERAEMHWVARRGLQEGVFCIPEKYRRSWEQLTWTHYEQEETGKGPVIKLEPKERVILRHGRSPDHADADVLAMRETMSGFELRQAGARVQTLQNGDAREYRNGRRPARRRRLPGGRRLQ